MRSSEEMLIGELAKLAGVTPRTIRHYESLGLVRAVQRKSNGFHTYDHEAVQRIAKINTLKYLGLSLEEIASVLDLYFVEPAGIEGKKAVLALLENHLRETDERLTALTVLREQIAANIQHLKGWIKAEK
ncbi:MerR family transcriptional regulator [Deinococcus sp. SL84]|uniref:MerR family transcriptional regulator n=1 Tax=Deinococcus sp. SL84 TaxID=2994663 RepID=UPI002275F871|nr:MerR family transcriptional regulator [Deinococcus sp. SL84]MCY1703870.1 MerR family transcriptional regulator [Deinococcus sp. SL84]